MLLKQKRSGTEDDFVCKDSRAFVFGFGTSLLAFLHFCRTRKDDGDVRESWGVVEADQVSAGALLGLDSGRLIAAHLRYFLMSVKGSMVALPLRRCGMSKEDVRCCASAKK